MRSIMFALSLRVSVLVLMTAVLCSGISGAFLGKLKPSPTPVYPQPPRGTTPSDIPYPYVGTSVTAALISMAPAEGAQYDGTDKDNVVVDIVGQGPVLWSVSRWNQGDLSPRLMPRHPYAQTNLGVPPGTQGYSSSDPKEASTQAWRPDIEKGVMLAAVARNGQTWDDGAPPFFATVACVTNSKGYGYSMKTGEFGKNSPNLDVTVGKVGEKGEANIDVAVAWFPYEEGWTGGYIAAPAEYSKRVEPNWMSPKSHSPDLPADLSKMVKWGKRGARLRLPGVRPYYDGMLFLTSTDPGRWNNDLNVMSAYTRPWGKGWRVQAREDKEEDPTNLVDSSEHMFAFLYVPFTSTGGIGGNVQSDGTVLRGMGEFTVSRVSEGKYILQINGGRKSNTDGILLLQVTGRDDAIRKYARHAFLSYNYTERGEVIVESHKLHIDKTAEGNRVETFPFVDADFSFLWVDFRHPLAPYKDMFTGSLAPKGSALPYWVGFLVGFGIAAASLAVFVIGSAHIAHLPKFSWNSIFRQHGPLLSVEPGEEELLRGPYLPADGNLARPAEHN